MMSKETEHEKKMRKLIEEARKIEQHKKQAS